MKQKRLLNIIGDINEDYIIEAAPAAGKKKRPVWRRWVAAAACLALAAGGLLLGSLTQDPEKNTADTILLVEYHNAYYEVVENNPQALARRGIKTEITKEVAGAHLAYLKQETEAPRSNYVVSETQTELELLEYAPAEQAAVRVLRDAEQYFAVILCNFAVADTECLPFDVLLQAYGITSAEALTRIVPVKTDNEFQANGAAVTDRGAITAFYDALLALEGYSEEAFDRMQFAGGAESTAEERYTQFAGDRRDLMLETADGLKFIVSYFPTFGWVRGDVTQTYYRLSPALDAWLDANLK